MGLAELGVIHTHRPTSRGYADPLRGVLQLHESVTSFFWTVANFCIYIKRLIPHVQNVKLYTRDLDLDLDSTCIQVDALGHTPTPF